MGGSQGAHTPALSLHTFPGHLYLPGTCLEHTHTYHRSQAHHHYLHSAGLPPATLPRTQAADFHLPDPYLPHNSQCRFGACLPPGVEPCIAPFALARARPLPATCHRCHCLGWVPHLPSPCLPPYPFGGGHSAASIPFSSIPAHQCWLHHPGSHGQAGWSAGVEWVRQTGQSSSLRAWVGSAFQSLSSSCSFLPGLQNSWQQQQQ